MLKRLLREMDVVNNSNVPRGIEAMAQMCCSMLSNPNTRPVIVFVDALNQFADEQAAKVMSWLPQKLAPRVRCIFTTVQDTPQHKILIGRETKPIELPIPALDKESRKGIVNDMLKKYGKTLSPNQMNQLLDKKSSENPLWLCVSCEELQLLELEDEIDRKIRELPDGLLKYDSLYFSLLLNVKFSYK
ncbi:hypothetical protein KUTeg_016718 [Tegillarca granosa]|uniref:Uncharacterized protein n=1 Tax=Tegillarca granosa TaxID=220873 RepID=A0ABQ9ELQ0_TEGGR|nr:hypothetical protein KUTeg_016718 [Tegillarca granosa]